jgi:threonine synthase
MIMWQGVIHQYRDFLPVDRDTPVISLSEGNTPLIYSEKLSKKTSLKVYLKYEGSNPTGSFKDRGITVAVSKAAQAKAKGILCASTGNTSASAAAYGARAGIPCFVLLPEGAVALGKLCQALMAKAHVIGIKGNFDAALQLARSISKRPDIVLVNSLNPDRIEGQKTAAFEICDALENESIDFHLMPVGNAGNIKAYWKGYREYLANKKISQLPKMLGFQADGAAPLVKNRVIPDPKTFASAIRIGNPASWEGAQRARDESGGRIDAVSDKQIMDSYRWLASEEGLFVEPASAASVAGLLHLHERGYFKKETDRKNAVAVCVLTGSGLKDPDSATALIKKPESIPANEKAVIEAMGL